MIVKPGHFTGASTAGLQQKSPLTCSFKVTGISFLAIFVALGSFSEGNGHTNQEIKKQGRDLSPAPLNKPACMHLLHRR